MALILNIDTALDTACISLAENGRLLQSAINENQKDHAIWTHNAISKLIQGAESAIGNLNAIGVSIGPGSYTGLRIGLSAAKGLCYALKIPLITINTLEMMTVSAIKEREIAFPDLLAEILLFCPMIDARRMEVFTAVYDLNLNEVIKPQALILDKNSFKDILMTQKILFWGNGSSKFQKVCQNPHAIFKKMPLNAFALATLTYRNFIGNNFADLAYTEPLYLKEFFTK
jgi:tRNA threonylcarbamoyladenosine biosynthesis protein TsaB